MPKSKTTPNTESVVDIEKVVVRPGPNLWVNVSQPDLDFIIRVVGEKTQIAGEEGWRAALDLLTRLRNPVAEPPFMSQSILPAPDAGEPVKKSRQSRM